MSFSHSTDETGDGPRGGLRLRWSAMSPETRQRAWGIALALAIEAGLLLLLLTLGAVRDRGRPDDAPLVSFTASDAQEDTPERAAAPPEPAAAAATRPVAQPRPPQDRPPDPVSSPLPDTRAPALIPITPDAMRSTDIARIAPPARSVAPVGPVGPADTPRPGDSQRIAGSGPHGEPLYAARWYREPSNDELQGYLSTAQGPGWGLINCQTAPQFRVENCELVAESPQGSDIGRTVLAAAWQFKVRPPQVGGQPQVGAWVRIRIDYQVRRQGS